MWQVEVLQAFLLRDVLKLETHLGDREKVMKQYLDSHTVIWPLKHREPCWPSVFPAGFSYHFFFCTCLFP